MGVLSANPLVTPAAFDVVVCAGVTSPGIFEIKGGDRHHRWDNKKAAAAQGSVLTYQGWNPTTGIVGHFKFWTPQQIDFFYNTFLPVLKYDALKKKPQPIQIFHPALFANDILSVVTEKIGQITHEGLQMWTVDVEWTEYRPPPPANVTSTPTSTNTNGSSKQKPTAQDEQDKQIQQLLVEAQKPI